MKRKRWIALILSAVMLLSLVPTAYATICDVHTPTRQVTQEPTCVDYGYYINVCAVCGVPLDNGGTIPPLGHDFRNDWSEMYPATCTEPGMEIRFCHRCQQEEVRTTSALGHHWEEQTVFFKDPTCTEDGFREYLRRCTRCGEYDQSLPITGTEGYRVNIPALGHDWGNWKQETPGNCVQKELKVRTCRRCGLEQYVYGDYGDHDWGEWHVVIPAAPGKFGLEERICKIEPSHRETRDLPPLPGDSKPALTIVWDDDTIHDASADKWYNTKEPGVLAPEDEAEPNYTVTNTGNMTLMVVGYAVWDNGKDDPDSPLFVDTLEPGESVSDFWDGGSLPISKWVTPDTATDELMGTATITFWAVGVEDLEDLDKPLCETEHLSRTWQVAKPERAAYVLKGVERDFDGYYMDASGCQPNYLDGRAYHFIWEDAEPVHFTDYHAGVSQFFKDSGETIPLMTEPVAGETYYFDIVVFNDIGNTDHSMDFSQVDAELVDVTMKGFTVAYLGFMPEVRDDFRDACTLYFSATYLGKPELTISFVKAEPAKDVYDPDDVLRIDYTVENTGDVPLFVDIVLDEYIDGQTDYGHIPEHVLQPGESLRTVRKHDTIQRFVKPGTATDELLGIDEITVYAYGYDAGSTSKDTGHPDRALCKSNEVTNEFKVGRAAPGTYILKGVSKDFPGVKESMGLMYPDKEPNPIGYTWADKEGKLEPEFSCLCLDSANSQPLASPPKKGETYYFFILLNSGFGAGDHAIDFSQIDPALVNVTLAGFDVQYLGYDYVEGEDGVVDHAQLFFSATCDKADGPELTLVWNWDEDHNFNPYPDGTIFAPDDGVYADHTVTNTGNVPLIVVLYDSWLDGYTYTYFKGLLDPDQSTGTGVGFGRIEDRLDPGSETAELMGTATITFWYVGYDPDTYVNSSNPGTELCRSNEITRVWKVRKEGVTTDDPDELNPAISVTIWADPGAGDGKRYEGAQVNYHYEVTNTGNCPVYVLWWPDLMTEAFDASAPNGRAEVTGMGWGMIGVALLNPGETYSNTQYEVMHTKEVEDGYFKTQCWDGAWYYDTNGDIQYIEADSNELTIPLTYPDGDPAKPALEIKWLDDKIHDASADLTYYTTNPGVLEAEDDALAHYEVTNAGNVPLKVITHAVWANGKFSASSPWPMGILAPGESVLDVYGTEPLGEWITPGTDTAELLGTATVTFWATGHDPETGEQLCETEHLSRTWQVRKPGPTEWEIPEESKLEVSISRGYNDQQAYPEGHQLGEWWDTNIYVFNNGPVDVEDYTLHVDVEASGCEVFNWGGILDATDGATWYEIGFHEGIAAGDVDDLWDESPDGEVVPGDVGRGYIKLSAYVTWEDPDSEKPRTSNVASISLPVTSKTGLLLQKKLDHGPADGEYFKVDEVIDWELTVKNTSNEPIYNVVVTDNGAVVGTFPVLLPGQKEACTVPGHTVTEYDADVVGYVLNQAFAEGDDLQGARHSYPSNVVKAICSDVMPPDPPEPPTPPDKNKDKDGDPDLKGDGGEACKLTLTAIGDSEARYALHACAEHLAAAQAAENAVATDRVNGWQAAADIWSGEIDKLYQALAEEAKTEEAQNALLSDQNAFWDYVDAFATLNAGKDGADQAMADLLRLRCAELCCMRHTAPDQLPDSLLGDYATIAGGMAASDTSRTISRLNGSDSDVTVKLDEDLTSAMRAALSTVRNTRSANAADAFVSAQAQWQMTLDSAVNAQYRAADRDARKLIAAWRRALDQVIQARTELLSILYQDHEEILQERLMNLYRDAAIDARIAK